MEAIAIRMRPAITLEAIAIRLESIAVRMEAIAIRMDLQLLLAMDHCY